MKRLCLILFLFLSAFAASSQNEAGPDKVVCKGNSVKIGSADMGYCYFWDPATGISDRKSSNPTVTPTTTTTYKLIIVGQNFSFRREDEVVVTVVENTVFAPSSVTVASGATPKVPLSSRPNYWGYTDDENIEIQITACSDGTNWHAIVNNIKGNYSEEVRLLPGVVEVTGIGGNTTQANFCNQVVSLNGLTLNATNWFILSAVRAHEDVHATRLKPSLEDVAANIETLVEAITVPDNGQTQQNAIAQIKATLAYRTALTQGAQLWDAAYVIRIANDHQGGAGPTYVAEHGVVDPMIASICSYARSHSWPACASCPP